MKRFLMAAALAVATVSPLAQGQTLNMMKSLDAPHYDGHRTTWSPSSDIINMIQDTLVALDILAEGVRTRRIALADK